MTEVISVRFRNGCKEYYFDPKGLTVPTDTDVIVETAQGPEFARCSQGNHQVEDGAVVKPLRENARSSCCDSSRVGARRSSMSRR